MSAFDGGANFDPVDYYAERLERKMADSARSYFDDVLRKSGVDEGETEIRFRKYAKLKGEHERETARLGRFRGLRTALYVILGIAFFIGTIGIVVLSYLNPGADPTAGIVMLVLGFAIGIALLVVNLTVVARKINELSGEASIRAKKLSDAKEELDRMLYPLRSGFAFDDFQKLVAMTTDMFTVDTSFSEERLEFMKAVYAYGDVLGEHQSAVNVMSGEVKGNPYVRFYVKSETMVDTTYTGHLTISWTESYVDSEGHVRQTVRSQVLTAIYTAPAPSFIGVPALVYGNLAAPDLSFSRSPSGADMKDEKELARYVEKQEKELRKKAEDSVGKGRGFQPLANAEFEALFGAYDRDDEVQFRLLFTPLAQQNMLELIKGKAGYGDDFSFRKERTINVIQSIHAGGRFTYDPDFGFEYLSVKMMRDGFVSMMGALFKSLYFDLAPVLAIPLYQMTDAGNYDVKKAFRSDLSDYEAMVMVNHMDPDAFRHVDAATDQILRPRFLRRHGKSDVFEITSLSFSKEAAVAYVPVKGGDGNVHGVPVQYYIYTPLTRKRNVTLRRLDEKKERWDARALRDYLDLHDGEIYHRFASFLGSEDGEDDPGSFIREEEAFEGLFTGFEERLEKLDSMSEVEIASLAEKNGKR